MKLGALRFAAKLIESGVDEASQCATGSWSRHVVLLFGIVTSMVVRGGVNSWRAEAGVCKDEDVFA